MRPRVDSASVRPIRLWHTKLKVNLPYRYYANARNAHLGAMAELRWGKIGETIEVYDASNGRLLGQYTSWARGMYFSR